MADEAAMESEKARAQLDDERDTSEMVQAMERMDRILNEQEARLHHLGARLDPIMGPAEDGRMEGSVELAAVRRNSAHVETMSRLADKINEHNELISEIASRLEV